MAQCGDHVCSLLAVWGRPVYLPRALVLMKAAYSVCGRAGLWTSLACALVDLSVAQKSKVITNTELKWKKVLKTINRVLLLFMLCFWSLEFFHSSPAPGEFGCHLPCLVPLLKYIITQKSIVLVNIYFYSCVVVIFLKLLLVGCQALLSAMDGRDGLSTITEDIM